MTTDCKNEEKNTPFSEEDVCIVSKRDPCVVWAGTKILYSGSPFSGLTVSGFCYHSNESDIEPISCSGWGRIRVPELNQLHHIFVFPKNPCIHARSDYLAHVNGIAPYSASGVGGCSGKVALIRWKNECDSSGNVASGACSDFFDCSGTGYKSGLVDIIAFGSEF